MQALRSGPCLAWNHPRLLMTLSPALPCPHPKHLSTFYSGYKDKLQMLLFNLTCFQIPCLHTGSRPVVWVERFFVYRSWAFACFYSHVSALGLCPSLPLSHSEDTQGSASFPCAWESPGGLVQLPRTLPSSEFSPFRVRLPSHTGSWFWRDTHTFLEGILPMHTNIFSL